MTLRELLIELGVSEKAINELKDSDADYKVIAPVEVQIDGDNPVEIEKVRWDHHDRCIYLE